MGGWNRAGMALLWLPAPLCWTLSLPWCWRSKCLQRLDKRMSGFFLPWDDLNVQAENFAWLGQLWTVRKFHFFHIKVALPIIMKSTVLVYDIWLGLLSSAIGVGELGNYGIRGYPELEETHSDYWVQFLSLHRTIKNLRKIKKPKTNKKPTLVWRAKKHKKK